MSKRESQETEGEREEHVCRCLACPVKEEMKVLEEKNKVLEGENLRLKLELQEFRERYWLKKKKRKEEKEADEDSPKKRGAPVGHRGWWRKRPKKVDEVQEVRCQRCPNCGSDQLSECKEVEEHLQEDIEIPRVRATLYRKQLYWCRGCKDVVSGRGKMELPNSFIGPVAKSLGVWLKYDVKISDRDLKRLFKKLFNLKLVPASLCGFRNQLRREAYCVFGKLKEALRKSSHAYVDETGWKVDGLLHQLWSASNDKLSVFMIHKSRGSKALKELMGEEFRGKLISDFLNVYDRFKAKAKQKCNVHLLREIKKILKNWPEDEAVQRYGQGLKELIQQALKLKEAWKDKSLRKADFEKKRRLIAQTLSDFEISHPDRKPLQRLAKRLRKYKTELLTFLFDPLLEGHNNRAERQIRPNVIYRKIMFGNRSPQGAENHSVLMSLIATSKLQGKDPADVLKRIWLSSPKKRSIEMLGLKAQAP